LLVVDHLFSGSALCAVNEKGRLLLPGFVRFTLARRTDARSLLIGSHEHDPCLIAYDAAYARALHADCERRRIAEERDAPAASARRLRRLFGLAETAAIDEQGAIVLPPMVRRHARIGAQALVVGIGGAFELWDPEAALGHDDPGLRELAAFHKEVRHVA
jgi:MraZ protein